VQWWHNVTQFAGGNHNVSMKMKKKNASARNISKKLSRDFFPRNKCNDKKLISRLRRSAAILEPAAKREWVGSGWKS